MILTQNELSSIKWFTEEWFDTPLEFYAHLKQHPECLGIDGESKELVLTAKIGEKEKSVGITMNVARLEGLKQVRIAQKKNLLQTQTGHRTHPTVLGTHRSEVGRYGEIKGIISGGVEAEAESSAWVVEESEEDNRCK